MRSYLFLIFALLMLSCVGAEINSLGTIKQGENITIKQQCASCTYVNISISFPNSSLAIINEEMTNQGGGLWVYNFSLTSDIGRYDIQGSGDLEGTDTGFDILYFEITKTGYEYNGATNSISITLLILLSIFFFIALYGLFAIENYIANFTLYWVCHIILVIILFISWNMASLNILEDSAIAGVFKILFYFFQFAMIPMVFLSMAWIFYIHTFNEHFQKLIDKGMDTEEAFKMTQNKKGGWFSGK